MSINSIFIGFVDIFLIRRIRVLKSHIAILNSIYENLFLDRVINIVEK